MSSYDTRLRSELHKLYDHLSGLDELSLSVLPVTDRDARQDVVLPMCLIYITEEFTDWATGFDVGDVIIAPGNGDVDPVPDKDVDHVLGYLNDAFYDEHPELTKISPDDDRWPTEDDPVSVLAEVQLEFVRHERWCLTAYSFDLEEERINHWSDRSTVTQ